MMWFRSSACILAAMLLAGCGDTSGPPVKPVVPVPDTIPVTGQEVPGLASFDRLMPPLLRRWGVPGAAVAVVRDGRLVFARGYGWADTTARSPVAPDALFRIASVSKPITAVAVLKLVEEGRLQLHDRAFDILDHLQPPAGATVDPRIRDITIRQLLHHAGGWDRDASFDPMFRPGVAAQAVGADPPAGAETVIRYMLGQPLDFSPGGRYAYSNFGYAVLGRVIEKVTGETYEDYVRRAVLAPAGVQRMQIGRSRADQRAPGEVTYYGGGSAQSVFPGGGVVPAPYGSFYLEAMDAHGGWIASTVDLLRFLTAVDGFPTRPDILQPSSLQQMVAPPPAPLWQNSAIHYAMGWLVRPAEGNWWHDGSLPGTTSLLVRTGGGTGWAVLLNARSTGIPGTTLIGELDQLMWQAVGEASAWPAHNLFNQFQ